MKFTRMKWAICGLCVLLLAACSSGSSGGGGTPAAANSMSITTTDSAGAKSTFTADNSNSIISAYKNDVENKTIVQICSDVDKDNDCSRLIIITIDGTTAQKYSMNSPDSLTQIVYQDDETETGILSHYMSSDGEVDVSEIGSTAGSAVKGAFTTTLACNSGCSGNITVTGNYNVALSQ